MFLDGIDHFLETPRDSVRLLNALQVTYPAVRGEVNAVDFVAVETLRVFCPTVYEAIRTNPQMFIGHTENHQADGTKVFYKSLLEQVPEKDREAVKDLLARIFPKAHKVWRNVGHGASWEQSWRKDLRVCSESVFPVFFRLSLPDGGLSRLEMEALLAAATDAAAFRDALLTLSREPIPKTAPVSKLRSALERLEDFTERDIPAEHIVPLLTGLFDAADALVAMEPERKVGLWSLGLDNQIGRLMFLLIRRLPEPDRFALQCDLVTHGGGIETILHEVAVLGQQHGKFTSRPAEPDEACILTAQHLADLEALAVERLRAVATSGQLMSMRRPVALLFMWREWSGTDEAREWAQRLTASDEGLLSVLEKVISKVRSQSDGSYAVIEYDRIDPRGLEPLLPVAFTEERVRVLAERQDIPDGQRKVAQLYLKACSQTNADPF